MYLTNLWVTIVISKNSLINIKYLIFQKTKNEQEAKIWGDVREYGWPSKEKHGIREREILPNGQNFTIGIHKQWSKWEEWSSRARTPSMERKL